MNSNISEKTIVETENKRERFKKQLNASITGIIYIEPLLETNWLREVNWTIQHFVNRTGKSVKCK